MRRLTATHSIARTSSHAKHLPPLRDVTAVYSHQQRIEMMFTTIALLMLTVATPSGLRLRLHQQMPHRVRLA